MAKRLTIDEAGGVVEEFLFDETENTVGVRHSQDVAPVLDYVAEKRLETPKYVEGMGYEIATLPIALCVKWGNERGLPNGWFYRDEYNAELKKLIGNLTAFNPWGKQQ